MRGSDRERNVPALVAVLGVRGVWQAQTEVVSHIRVADTDTQSHVQCSMDAMMKSA